MPDPRDQVEIEGLNVQGERPAEAQPGHGPRPMQRFLSLWFSCAKVYGRAYPNPAGTEYCGRCGKCGKSIAFPIGASGTRQRTFEVRCD